MYENHKLCENLKPKEICIVVEQYKEGNFEQQFPSMFRGIGCHRVHCKTYFGRLYSNSKIMSRGQLCEVI
jgi:hypothetical protein